VTIAKRPFCVGRDGEDEEVICVESEAEYFCEGGWTGEWRHSPTGNQQIDLSQRRHDDCPTGVPDFGAAVTPRVMASVTWRV
jgi:hypothetical protein